MRYQLPPNLVNNRLNFLGVQNEEIDIDEDEEDEEEERVLLKIRKEAPLPKEPELGIVSQDFKGKPLFVVSNPS
jgi:hypothetical protein